MQYFTGTQLSTRIREDLGIIDETNTISDSTMLAFLNEGIDIAEAIIHTLYEDYFLDETTISTTLGSQEYSLPSGIYANKIRGLVFHVNTEIYEVKRIRGRNIFREIRDIMEHGSTDRYKYILKNTSAAAGVKIKIYPASRETSSTALQLWYLRNATRLSALSDTCDIPEWSPFVVAWGKKKCVEKLRDRPVEPYIVEAEAMKKLMTETLSTAVPDDDDTVPMDKDHYEDHE